jgi:protocatechuate 3,4-dioxygenase beta subunit
MSVKGITRRQSLGLAGLAGAAYVTKPFGGLAPRAGGVAGPDVAEGASCVVAPSVTEGPYWVDEGLKRSDVTGGQAGVPLVLKLYVFRADDSCSPQEGAVVDIWHCNAAGLYSDEAVEGTTGDTWLRGYQVTDANGLATFTTIYPGWYSGRTIHIHVRVRVFSDSTTTFNYTTQIFFSESDSSAVIATSPYNSRGVAKDTSNASDMIYQQEAQAGNVLLPTLAGNTSSGFSGTVSVGLNGLPSGGRGGDTKVEANLVSKEFGERKGRRDLELGIKSKERIGAHAKLLRHGTVIAHKKIGALAPGTRTLTVPIGDGVAAGNARLKLVLTDQSSNTKTIKRRLHSPAA